ncbi:MAG: long-chain fatty acid--CoA ligase [Kouleothrix sp.]|jgi:long-chain acyl-CoA synthetase|nr:long-chain fatty acid--CoA ligase [Kouleothrix sp.]
MPTTDRPWLAHYDAGVPHTIDVPPIALPELLASAAREFPRAPATLFYGAELSYAELDRLATRCAAGLRAAGVQPGERVALVLPNVPQAVICYYGALRAGAVVVLANPLFEAGSLIRQVEDAQATSIVALSMFHPLVAQVRERVSFERVIYTNLKEYLPTTQRRLFTLLRQEREGHLVPGAEADRSLWLARMLEPASAAAALPPIDPSAPAVILYTGGTTGEAKGVVHSHRSLVANALQTSAWVPELRRGRERVLCALPFSHAYGMTACMNFAVQLAAAMILLPTFETQNVLHAIRRDRPTLFPGVPPMYAAITDVKDARGYGLASLRACLSGAAPLPIEVQEGFERITRARLVEGYGLSEAGPVTHVNPLGATQRRGFIGVPLPSTDARIVDADSGADLPPGQIGELLVRGPQLMQGYWGRPAETAEALTPDGWLRTGDLARMDAAGFFQVIERKKEMIVAGRYNIYPRDIEEVLYEHPKVLDAAVAGVPRSGGTTDVKAFVVLRRGESATADEILQFLRERLSAYKLPSAVEFREALPRSFIGKVLRRILVEGEQTPGE